MSTRKLFETLGLFIFFTAALLVGGCIKSQTAKDKETAEKLWGSERVCLPCHLFQQPIARKHNYRCDTCHLGNPWAEDKEEGHFEMIKSPQIAENIGRTCDKCHRRVLGRDVPYNAEFIRDVIVSHKRKEGESLEWQQQ
ncbi:MAG TPA: hypothetical protein VI895_00375 [Bdellovibrionota bacterium]|nr:hypothetical protein [Bdellovibrionota bacterium]